MSFSLLPFLAATSAGEQINANLAATQADTQLKMQSLANGQQQQQQQQQQMQQRQAAQSSIAQLMSGWQKDDANAKQSRIDAGQDPNIPMEQTFQQQADRYRQMSQQYAAFDPTTAESYSKLADAADGKVGTIRTQNLAIAKQKTQDLAATAGAAISGDMTPEDTFKWVKDNYGMQEAMNIPLSPQDYQAYWKSKQTQGLTAQQQIENAQTVQDSKDKADAAEEAHADRQEAIRARQADAAANREVRKSQIEASTQAAADRAQSNQQNTQFRQSTKLNNDLTRQAKPYLDDMQRLDDIQGLLQTNSSAADQQVRQSLTSLLGSFKGRATNQYYKDNANFGSAANRLTGMLSHGFTGQFQDSDRQQIAQLVSSMRDNVVAPALSSMERGAKQKAQGYGLDPDQIEINADFTRAPGASASSGYAEGQTATGPGGQKVVFKGGKWVAQ
jgi:hypothetical protein